MAAATLYFIVAAAAAAGGMALSAPSGASPLLDATYVHPMFKAKYGMKPLGPGAVAPAAGNYTEMNGYLAAGDDIVNGNYTYAQACAECDSLPGCAGFTFENGAQQPTSPVNVYFKSAINFVAAAGWYSYVLGSTAPWPDINATVGGMKVSLRANSHTVQLLNLVNDPMPPHNFSFVPPLAAFNRPDRTGPGNHQLGDVTLRLQSLSSTNASSWAMFGSSWAGGTHNSVPLPGPYPPTVIASDDITALLNSTPANDRIQPSIPLSVRVSRTYASVTDLVSGDVALQMTINVTAITDTRLGGFGFSLPADDNTNQALAAIAFTNSFIDPHMGADHGFAEWTRVVGNASLLVTPGAAYSLSTSGVWSPAGRTPFQAWRPLLEDPHFNGVMSEWTVLSEAWASEWDNNAQAPVLTMPTDLSRTGVWPNPRSPWPSWHTNETVHVPNMRSRYWNPPTSIALPAGTGLSYSILLGLTSSGQRSRNSKLIDRGEPVLQGIPGYVIGTDMTSAFLYVTPPRGTTLSSVDSVPSGILSAGTAVDAGNGRVRVPISGLTRGRVRVGVHFSDGSEAAAHYHVLPPFPTLIAAAGAHWANVSWLPRSYPDPFGRSAAVLPWDRESNAWVLDDSRAYIVGLSDDAGAAQNLGHAMKIAFAPNAFEVSQKDSYISNTLMGTKPDTAKAPLRSLQTNNAIRMTMYYYCAGIDNGLTCQDSGHWPYAYPEQNKCHMPVGGPIWCMIETLADQTYRGFNVPHQAATWYAMYRVARFYTNIKTVHPWQYYLQEAYQLTNTLGTPNVGLMDDTVFREIMNALLAEGADNTTIRGWGTRIQGNMQQRAADWNTQVFPYGSEFNWDTTGQEGVYVWLQNFGFVDSANRTLTSMLSFMNTVPNWAYNGGARSIGDLGNNGLWFVNRGTERVLQHYRAGLNMIPVMEGFQYNPDDRLLLDIAVGSQAGQLANIDANGAVSMGFHSFPFVLEYDPHSGDYGLGFFGHTLEIASVLVSNPGDASLPFLCYFCNFASPPPSSGPVTFAPTDSYRVRTYLEPIGALFAALAGTISSVTVDFGARTMGLTFAPPSTAPAMYDTLWLEISKKAKAGTRPGIAWVVTAGDGSACPLVRGAYQITPAPGGAATTVNVKWIA